MHNRNSMMIKSHFVFDKLCILQTVEEKWKCPSVNYNTRNSNVFFQSVCKVICFF